MDTTQIHDEKLIHVSFRFASCVTHRQEYLRNGKEDTGESQTILDRLSLVQHNQQPERCTHTHVFVCVSVCVRVCACVYTHTHTEKKAQFFFPPPAGETPDPIIYQVQR